MIPEMHHPSYHQQQQQHQPREMSRSSVTPEEKCTMQTENFPDNDVVSHANEKLAANGNEEDKKLLLNGGMYETKMADETHQGMICAENIQPPEPFLSVFPNESVAAPKMKKVIFCLNLKTVLIDAFSQWYM